MEGQYLTSREDLYQLQMEVKHVQSIQTNHADRLLRLEKRQADDAALKSVWNSPFPSVMGGSTPQHGPVVASTANVFDDFDDEHGHSLIGSLHLDAEDEPVRRGASRANSVRFATNDVSAIHGADWSGSRSSGEFGPVRPSSGLGGHPIERSSSHKSDGRHSSAGYSVHSVHSGRTSSLGLDTNFQIGGPGDEESPLETPEPPPGLFILGSVPSIIRCWLHEDFQSKSLLYAVVCTGSQNSTIELSLVKELGLISGVHKNNNGASFIRLPVYLPEAIVSHPSSRVSSPSHHLPSFTATFEVVSITKLGLERKKTIRIFIGSDTLRAHSADVLFSQNAVSLYGDDRNKLTVPFVRPEDEMTFKNLRTISVADRVELKATALPFKPSELSSIVQTGVDATKASNNSAIISTPTISIPEASSLPVSEQRSISESIGDDAKTTVIEAINSTVADEPEIDTRTSSISPQLLETPRLTKAVETEKRDSPRVWGSWRTNGTSSTEDSSVKDSGSYSRKSSISGVRGMKVLKPSKVPLGRSVSAARTGPSYEPPIARSTGESRRKSQGGLDNIGNGLNSPDTSNTFGGFEKVFDRGFRSTDRSFDKASSLAGRWDSRKVVNDEKNDKVSRPVLIPMLSKSTNPVGGASAFVWTK